MIFWQYKTSKGRKIKKPKYLNSVTLTNAVKMKVNRLYFKRNLELSLMRNETKMHISFGKTKTKKMFTWIELFFKDTSLMAYRASIGNRLAMLQTEFM